MTCGCGDPLPSRTRPRGTEALGFGEASAVFRVGGTAPPVATGTVILALGLFTLAITAGVILASRD